MPTKQDKTSNPQVKRIAGIEIRSNRELAYVLSSMTILIVSVAVFIIAIVKTYFLYTDIKEIKQENQFLNKQLRLIESVSPETLKQEFDTSIQRLPQDLNLSELANRIKQQATKHGLDIVQLAVTEEVTVREEQIGDKKLNKTITVKKVYIPIQVKGSLNNQIKFLEYIREQDTNLWFDEVRLSQIQNTETQQPFAQQTTWNLRLQLMQITFPYVKLKQNEVIDLIYQLQLEKVLK